MPVICYRTRQSRVFVIDEHCHYRARTLAGIDLETIGGLICDGYRPAGAFQVALILGESFRRHIIESALHVPHHIVV